MPLIVVGQGTPIVAPGTYPATLIGVRPKKLVTKFAKVPGEEQDFLEWTWLVDGPDREVEITSLTSLATGPKSTMFMVLNALLGKDAVTIGAGFEESDLVGKTALVQIVETEEGFAKIDKIVAAPRTRATAVAEAKAEPLPEPIPDPSVEAGDDLPF